MKKRLRKYAEDIGAVDKNSRVNWHAVAENLANKYEPALLGGVPPRRRVGRPKLSGDLSDDCWLAIEIDYVKTSDQLSIENACEQICKNRHIRFLLQFKPVDPTKPVTTLPNPWRNIGAGTLKRRHQRWLKAEKLRQDEMKIVISDDRPYDPEVARDLERRLRDLDQLK